MTLKLADAVFRRRSLAVRVITVFPWGKSDPDGGSHSTPTIPSTVSNAPVLKETVIPSLFQVETTMLPGTLSLGAVVSTTVIENPRVRSLPLSSFAVHVTTVRPIGKRLPETGEQKTATNPSMASWADGPASVAARNADVADAGRCEATRFESSFYEAEENKLPDSRVATAGRAARGASRRSSRLTRSLKLQPSSRRAADVCTRPSAVERGGLEPLMSVCGPRSLTLRERPRGQVGYASGSDMTTPICSLGAWASIGLRIHNLRPRCDPALPSKRRRPCFIAGVSLSRRPDSNRGPPSGTSEVLPSTKSAGCWLANPLAN
jgi:hypothetical protein